MNPRRRRKIQPNRSPAPTERVPTRSEQADAHLGGDERDVVPTTPPTASPADEQGSASAQIDSNDELTPG